MLVTSLNFNQISERLDFDETNKQDTKLGTLFELVRNVEDNEAHMKEDFGASNELKMDWKNMSIVYVGKTRCTDGMIEDRGKIHPRTFTDSLKPSK